MIVFMGKVRSWMKLFFLQIYTPPHGNFFPVSSFFPQLFDDLFKVLKMWLSRSFIGILHKYIYLHIPALHSGLNPYGNSGTNFWVWQLSRTALTLWSMCHKLKVAGTHQKSFTEKKRRFFGLKMWLLLSKIKKRLHHTPDFISIW